MNSIVIFLKNGQSTTYNNVSSVMLDVRREFLMIAYQHELTGYTISKDFSLSEINSFDVI